MKPSCGTLGRLYSRTRTIRFGNPNLTKPAKHSTLALLKRLRMLRPRKVLGPTLLGSRPLVARRRIRRRSQRKRRKSSRRTTSRLPLKRLSPDHLNFYAFPRPNGHVLFFSGLCAEYLYLYRPRGRVI